MVKDNNDELVFSSAGLSARILFRESDIKYNIFVEDTNKEYEYEEIFERLIPEIINKITIHAVGGKTNLEEKYNQCGDNKNNFFIADGDFDIALNRKQIKDKNFIYLKKYNIECYYFELDEKIIIDFMRPILGKIRKETEEIVDYRSWKEQVTPFFKQIFAAHFFVQNNNLSIPNVSKCAYFVNEHNGLPDKEKYEMYLAEIRDRMITLGMNVLSLEDNINIIITFLEETYGKDFNDYVCGKYYLFSLARYLSSKSKKKLSDIDIKRILIPAFNILSLNYLKAKILSNFGIVTETIMPKLRKTVVDK